MVDIKGATTHVDICVVVGEFDCVLGREVVKSENNNQPLWPRLE